MLACRGFHRRKAVWMSLFDPSKIYTDTNGPPRYSAPPLRSVCLQGHKGNLKGYSSSAQALLRPCSLSVKMKW